ncbi:MAG: hypothetical protein HYS44_03215 [Candidatus Niyogibacteria bacterium]|nr:hypothetical protein [Candidatus Niyogibacteria bacterium]
MEIHRLIKKCIFYAVTTLLWPSLLFAYEVGTHAALTDKTIDFFNIQFPTLKIADPGKESIKVGSIAEDDGARFFHHFYDPVYERGLFGFSSSKLWAEATIEQGGLAAVGAGGIKELFSTEDDYSWERGIYEYAWGDKKRGLETLGHILHLIQDASVPDHTRNDPHPPISDWGSPYEHWTKKFESGFEMAGIANQTPTLFNSLKDFFGNLATYSNNNFFSKDTIFDESYESPRVFKRDIIRLMNGEEQLFGYGLDKYGEYRLVLIKKDIVKTTEEYFIKDNDDLILSDYWSRLSKQAVLHGAGVIKLFFDEVEKEKQTKALYAKNRTWFQKIFDASRDSIFNISAALYGSSVTLEDLADSEVKLPSDEVNTSNQGLTSGTDEVKPLANSGTESPQPSIEVRPLSALEAEPHESRYDPNPPMRDAVSGLIAIPAGSAGAGGEAPRATEPVIISIESLLETATSTDEAATSTPEMENASSTPPVNMDIVASSTESTIEISEGMVVRIEIAWLGTATSSADEWIELYNPTGIDIPLEHWFIRAADGVPFIELNGIIPAKGFYLIERTDDDTVSDITADLIAPFSGSGNGSGLENGGEKLFLKYFDGEATTTVDEVGTLGPLGRWCTGIASPWFWTMERYDANASGNDCANWGRNNQMFFNGHDAGGARIIGTPKAKNSVSYQITNGTTLMADKTLTKENSPYVVPSDGVTIAAGVTLAIEPGVVIKFSIANEPAFVVRGALRAEGALTDPIVFTAFADDEYGGDLNHDGACEPANASSTARCPAPGGWKNISFEPTSKNSVLRNVIARYGGRWFTNMLIRSSVVVDRTDVILDGVTAEYSMKHGLYLNVSSSTVQNSHFDDNDSDSSSAGLFVVRGAPEIRNSTFSNNAIGLRVENATTTLENVEFAGNALDIQAVNAEILCIANCIASTTFPSPLW